MKHRLLEIDALRGIAIVFMVLFHLAFDLTIFGYLDWQLWSGAWWWVWLLGISLFLSLAGLSVHLSSRSVLGQVKRGAGIFMWGMVITLVTALFMPDQLILFGVLHFIGVAVMLVRLFKGRPALALLAALLSFVLGQLLSRGVTDQLWLFPLGLTYPGFFSGDYFPLFPCLAIPLVGLVIGECFYAEKKPRLPWLGSIPGLAFLGRHSLKIYLIHQPVLLGLISFFERLT